MFERIKAFFKKSEPSVHVDYPDTFLGTDDDEGDEHLQAVLNAAINLEIGESVEGHVDDDGNLTLITRPVFQPAVTKPKRKKQKRTKRAKRK